MAESGLTLQYEDYRLAISHRNGFATALASQSADQVLQVNEAIQSGYRRFWMMREWSFLEQKRLLPLTSGVDRYAMPEDTDRIIGNATLWDENTRSEVRLVDETSLRIEKTASSTGRPYCMAFDLRGDPNDGTVSTRYSMVFEPTPDGTYTLEYRARFIPRPLSTSFPYPVGGAFHSETIKAIMFAYCEKRFDDAPLVFSADAQELIAASIAHDLRQTPETLGYNGPARIDRGGGRGMGGVRRDYTTADATYTP